MPTTWTNLTKNTTVWTNLPNTGIGEFLLMETGDVITMETSGDKILLESSTATTWTNLTKN